MCLTTLKLGVSALGFKLLFKLLVFFTSITCLIPDCKLRGDTGSRLQLQRWQVVGARSSAARRTVSEWTSPPCVGTGTQVGKCCRTGVSPPGPRPSRCSCRGSAPHPQPRKYLVKGRGQGEERGSAPPLGPTWLCAAAVARRQPNAVSGD